MAANVISCPAGAWTKVADADDAVILEFRGGVLVHTVAGGGAAPSSGSTVGAHFNEGDKLSETFTLDVYVRPHGPIAVDVLKLGT